MTNSSARPRIQLFACMCVVLGGRERGAHVYTHESTRCCAAKKAVMVCVVRDGGRCRSVLRCASHLVDGRKHAADVAEVAAKRKLGADFCAREGEGVRRQRECVVVWVGWFRSSVS